MQAHENKTLHMLNKAIDDEPVCVLCILIIKETYIAFSNYTV
jgi:hypothetical protein